MTVRIPSYRLHKPSGRAVVSVARKDHYLGKYGSVESLEAYGQLIAKLSTGAPLTLQNTPTVAGYTVNEVILAFLQHAQSYYVKNNKLTAEYDCFRSALRPLSSLYGTTQAGGLTGFNASKLSAVRDKMVDLGWSRTYINKSVSRLRHVFRFGNRHNMLGTIVEGAAVITSLEDLEPLAKGRCGAVELPKRTSVPLEYINAIREKVNQRTKDMIDLCLLTGCRPGELVSLTTRMIDVSHGDVWSAVLDDHKMVHHDKIRVIAFGPKAKLILRKYLRTNLDARLFPIRRDTFSKTLVYWCKKLGLPTFTGHWLRHNCATNIREEIGLDGAQIILGHSDQRTTQIYAHLRDDRAIEIARKLG